MPNHQNKRSFYSYKFFFLQCCICRNFKVMSFTVILLKTVLNLCFTDGALSCNSTSKASSIGLSNIINREDILSNNLAPTSVFCRTQLTFKLLKLQGAKYPKPEKSPIVKSEILSLRAYLQE